MAFPGRQAAIVGVYLTKQAFRIDRTSTSLEIEAVKGALDDAGLKITDVDGICTNRPAPPIGGTVDPFYFWAEQLGQRPLALQEIGQGSAALAKMAALVSAGLAETVVYVSGKAGAGVNQAHSAVPTKAPRVGEWSQYIWGGTMVGWYAAWKRKYMHDYGATHEQLAEVACAARYHATLNPAAIMGSKGEITVNDVLSSKMISDPLRLLECALDNDGGYAIVITSAERAKNLRQKPIYVLGGAEWFEVDWYLNIRHPWINKDSGLRRATNKAFEFAGVDRKDIDVAGVYDCFTITTIRNLEEMGFCKVGEGADYVQNGRIRLGGELPVNTHGGLLSCSHNGPGVPAGMHTIEVVQQLRGKVEPARQVPNAKIGLAISQGRSVHGGGGVLIMGTEQ